MSENGVWASRAQRRGRFGKAGLQTRDNPKHALTRKGVLLGPSYAGKSVGSQSGLIRRSAGVRFPLPLPLSGCASKRESRVGL